MIVCSCFGVSAEEVEQLAQEGFDTVAAVTGACGAGSDCGACREQLAEIIAVSRLLGRRSAATPARCLAPADEVADSAY
jgi:bacterioferritin-associated ferredoxin